MHIDVPATLLGKFMFAHLLAASVLTFFYGRRRHSHTAGASILAVFAWLVPLIGPVCFAIFLASSREPRPNDR